jgi:hypothetical protein
MLELLNNALSQNASINDRHLQYTAEPTMYESSSEVPHRPDNNYQRAPLCSLLATTRQGHRDVVALANITLM